MRRLDHRALLALVLLAGFALRLVQLDFQPLWWDEGYSLFFATRDFGTMLARTAVDIHPPLYYALLQGWIAFAGTGEFSVRLFSVVVGTVTIPLIYSLAFKLFSRRDFALISALLCAISPMAVYYSQEVRMYGLVTLFSAGSVYLFVRLCRPTPGDSKTITAVGYVAATSVALYAHYYAVFVVAFEIIYVGLTILLTLRRSSAPRPSPLASRPSPSATRPSPLASRPSLRFWLAAWMGIALLFAPWILYAGSKLYQYVGSKVSIEQYSSLDAFTFLAGHLVAFSVGHLSDWTWLSWASCVPIGVAVAGVAFGLRRKAKLPRPSLLRDQAVNSIFLVLLYLFVPLTLGYLVNLVYPFHPVRNERLLLIAEPAWLVLLAIGIGTLWEQRRLWASASMLAIIFISGAALYDFYTVPRYPEDDYRPLIAEIQTLAQAGDALLASYPWQIGYLETYYAGPPLDVVETPSAAWIDKPALMRQDIESMLSQHRRIWLPALQTQGHILEDAIESLLGPQTYAVADTWFGTTRLELYAAGVDPAPNDQPIVFGSGSDETNIRRWGISSRAVAAGTDVLLVWLDAAQAGNGVKASLRLVDVNGNRWAQDDREVEAGTNRIGIPIPLGVPPGLYSLGISVYARDSGKLLGLASDGGGTEANLGQVTVVAPASPDIAAIPGRTDIDYGNGVHLVGEDLPGTVSPGKPISIALYWQAVQPITMDCALALQVVDGSGRTVGQTSASIARGLMPTTQWQPGQIVLDPQTIEIRGDAADGDYRVVAALVPKSSSNSALTHTIGTIAVHGRPHYYGAPAVSHAMAADFGTFGRLVGYDLSNNTRNVQLVLYWQAVATPATSYTVFVHLLDSGQTTRAQGDHIPGDGAYPTTSWVAGEYIADLYEMSLPPDAAPGEYSVNLGMYDESTGARISITDNAAHNSADNITLPTRINIP